MTRPTSIRSPHGLARAARPPRGAPRSIAEGDRGRRLVPPPRPRATPLVGLALALLLFPGAAGAQGLDEAMAHYREGRFEQALAAFEAVRESPTDEPAPLVTAYVHLGVIHAAMGDEVQARRDFSVALALDPQLQAPSELSPSLRRIFEAVRAGSEPLSITAEVPEAPIAGQPADVELSADHAPADLVRAVRIRAIPTDGEPWIGRVEGSSGVLSIPSVAWAGGARLDLVVEALTRHGGVLVSHRLSLRATLPSLAAPPPGPPEPSARDSSPVGGDVTEEAWFWVLIGTLVAGGVAAAVLIPTVGTQTVYELGPPTVVSM